MSKTGLEVEKKYFKYAKSTFEVGKNSDERSKSALNVEKNNSYEMSKSGLRPTYLLHICCTQHVSYNMLHATSEYTWPT